MILAPDAVRERRQQALEDLVAGRLGDEDAARQLIQIDPDYGPGWLSLGNVKLCAGDLDAAEPLLWSAVERSPSNPACYFALSQLYQGRGEDSLSKRLRALGLWKVSFYDEIPPELLSRFTEGTDSPDLAADPAVYDLLAEKLNDELADEPWPTRLLPYRLLNQVQRDAASGLNSLLIDEARENAEACVPLFVAALREAYETNRSTLSPEPEGLVMALLGEVGGVEWIDDLIRMPQSSPEATLHAQWAVLRLGQRFPSEALTRLRGAAKERSPVRRAFTAQHLYFLRAPKESVLELLDGFTEFGREGGAELLLLTVSTVLALLGSTGDAMSVISRYERHLSKEGRRWLHDAIEEEEDSIPPLIDIGLDAVTIEEVCTERVLMQVDEADEPEEEEDEEDEPPVVKPGRNDPCWCGSGKKYKKCHMDEDEREEREQRAEDNLFGDAWDRVLQFSREFHGRSDMDLALGMYFGGTPTDAEIVESGFVPWYVLDFRRSAEARTVIEEFLRRHAARLEPRQRELIESWRDHRYGLWEVQRIERGRGSELRDIFGGATYFVNDVTTSRETHQWDLMISRLHRFDGQWLFLADGLLVPRILLPRIREEVEQGARKAGVSAADYFRSQSHQWRRFVLDAHEQRWKDLRIVNFDGDPTEFSEAEYQLVDEKAAVAALEAIPALQSQTPAGEAGKRVFGWMGEADEKGRHRSYGRVEIAGGRLRIECNSRRRLEAGRKLIEERCGAAVIHLRDTFTSVDDLKGDVPKGPPVERPSGIDPEVERELVLKYYAEHYATWPDHPLPALGGRTPREAVRSKQGRQEVEELLRDFENSSERARREGRPAFDFSVLRRELGL